jgi:AAA ATPase domain
MVGVAELLGQNDVSAQIFEDLKHEQARIVRLTGPSGSGKSHIARDVALRWCESGGRCVVAVGDDENSSRELYPLLSGLSSAHRDWANLASTAARSTIAVAEAATGSPGVGVSIFDLLGSAFRQRTARALRPYADAERAVILDLNHLGRHHEVLLVADNAHWWDADSLRLLRGVLSDPLREAIPNLGSVVVLVVDTAEEQHVVAPETFDPLATASRERTQRVDRCGREVFAELLRRFGYERPLPDDVLQLLFDVTRGHLKLAEQVAAYAKDSTHGDLRVLLDGDFLTSMVYARFASLGVSRPDVSTLLVRAAVLGLSFNERDLQCLSEQKRSEILKLVELASAIGFVERRHGHITFSHDVIRSAILSDQSPQHLWPIYEKLSQCLAILRPGDYSARAQALLEADDHDGAREMIALAAVGQIRRGVAPARVLARVRSQAPDDLDLHHYCEIIAGGYAAVEEGDFSRMMPRLRTSLAGETVFMAAERCYLSAICKMELQTSACARDAQAILESWVPRLEGETELEIRFLVLRQQAQVLANMVDEARAIESQIEQRLLDRRGYDPDAAAMLQIQNRRAAAVDVPEVGEFRIEEAVEFFRRGTGDPSRDRLELFRALSNLTSVQIRLGKFAAAHEHAREAERLAGESPDSVRRLDVFANNLVLAAYRSDAIDLEQAIARQRLVVESPEGANDKLLQRCNLAGYLLLAGHDAEATALLDALDDEVQAGDFDESYLVFYVEATAVASAMFRGDVEEAARRHAAQQQFAESLKWPGAPYVRRRQVRIAEALRGFACERSRAEADEMLLRGRRQEIGPAWNYYGRLVPLCSLNFWSDS